MSESENPAIDAPEPKAHGPRSNRDWWPDQLDLPVPLDRAAYRAALGTLEACHTCDRELQRFVHRVPSLPPPPRRLRGGALTLIGSHAPMAVTGFADRCKSAQAATQEEGQSANPRDD